MHLNIRVTREILPASLQFTCASDIRRQDYLRYVTRYFNATSLHQHGLVLRALPVAYAVM